MYGPMFWLGSVAPQFDLMVTRLHVPEVAPPSGPTVATHSLSSRIMRAGLAAANLQSVANCGAVCIWNTSRDSSSLLDLHCLRRTDPGIRLYLAMVVCACFEARNPHLSVLRFPPVLLAIDEYVDAIFARQ